MGTSTSTSTTSTTPQPASTSTSTTTSTTVADIEPSIEAIEVDGTRLDRAEDTFTIPTANPGDTIALEILVRDDRAGTLAVLDTETDYPASPNGTSIDVTITIPDDMVEPEFPILMDGSETATIAFTPGDGWPPRIDVADPTGRTGEVTIEVTVTDLNGADTIESLTVAQEFNFQHPDHAQTIVAQLGLEPESVAELDGGLTRVSFDDPAFDFVYGAAKAITEYVSSNPLAPIAVTTAGPGAYEVSFSTDWPGRFPLHVTATDSAGNTTTARIPVEVFWSENPWEMRGVAIEFQYLRNVGSVAAADQLIETAKARNMNFVQLTPSLAAAGPESVELHRCDELAETAPQCLSPSPGELRNLIVKAHSLGLGVMLKPHLFAVGFNPFDIVPASWSAWFESYAAEILPLAELAEQTGVEVFSVGNELQSSHSQGALWRDLIAEVRSVYSGAITYSDFTHWTGPDDPFPAENLLDFHGVPFYYPGIGTNQDLYFGRVEVYDDPTMQEMAANIEAQVEELVVPRMNRSGNPAIATELGRFNHDGASWDPWGSQVEARSIDNQEQVDYFEAALRSASRHVDGVFFWSYKAFADTVVGGYGIDVRQHPIQDLVAIWSR